MSELFTILDEINTKTEIANDDSAHSLWTDWRSRAAANYVSLPLPNPRDKSWARLAEMKLPDGQYRLAEKPIIRHIQSATMQDGFSGQIEIREDSLEFTLDKQTSEKGVILCDLESASREYAPILEKSLARIQSTKAAKMTEFTKAMGRHGFLLYIPRDCRVEKPIEIVISLQNSGLVLPVQVLIVLEEESTVTLVSKQESAKAEGKASISLMNWLIDIGGRAELRFLEIQNYAPSVWNFLDEQISLGQSAILERLLVDRGSGVLQRRFSSLLQGADSRAMITGIYTPRKGQVFTYDTHQIHNASRTTSDLLFGGVLNDDAYSLWKGNVYVATGTKGADGFQRNKNLLLNEQAHAESIPGLEIVTDDVRCSHAVTLSSVDPEQLFFLRSRGIGEKEAEQLIVSGFLESAAARIRDDYLKERIRKELN